MLNIILVFSTSGWCEKLNKSYFAGRYQPKDKNEFEALKEFASEVIELKPVEAEPEILKDKKNEISNSVSAVQTKTTEESKDEKISEGTDEKNEEVRDFTDEQIAELRAKAKEAGLKNWHSKNPNTIIKELGIEL